MTRPDDGRYRWRTSRAVLSAGAFIALAWMVLVAPLRAAPTTAAGEGAATTTPSPALRAAAPRATPTPSVVVTTTPAPTLTPRAIATRAPTPSATPATPPAAAAGGSAAAKSKSSLSTFSLTAGKGPIRIRSDSLSVDYKGRSVVFSGHVHAQQSGTVIETDRMTIDYADPDLHQIKEILADGDVRVTQGGRWATSHHAVMDQLKRTIVMTGDPVVHDGDDRIAGSKITIYLDTGKSVVDAAHAVIFPKQGKSRDNSSSGRDGR